MREEAKKSLESIDRGDPASGGGFLGAELLPDEAALVMIPVPWEATASYGGGSAQGAEAILAASHQLDSYDLAFGKPFLAGIAMTEQDSDLVTLNRDAKAAADRVREAEAEGRSGDVDRASVNDASDRVNTYVYENAKKYLAAGKIVGVVGGDHSSPFGLLKALAEREQGKDAGGFGILHLDAHFDLRNAYEGFRHSHASIMYNATHELPAVKKLVQIGIRDFSRAELEYQETLGERGCVVFGRDFFRRRAMGESFASVARSIIEELPQRVYLSFDIDGMDPTYCPSTGTPVAGGLSYDEVVYLLEELADSKKTIIGFDLCEVAPSPDGSEWDANVGARLLYKMCGATLRSQGRC